MIYYLVSRDPGEQTEMGLTLHACDSLLKLHIIIYKKGAESCKAHMILVLIKRNATTALSKALGKECFQVGRAEKGRGADVATLQTATEGYKALLPVVVKSAEGQGAVMKMR